MRSRQKSLPDIRLYPPVNVFFKEAFSASLNPWQRYKNAGIKPKDFSEGIRSSEGRLNMKIEKKISTATVNHIMLPYYSWTSFFP